MCGEVIGDGRGTSTGGGESALVVGDPAGDVGIQEGLSGGQVGGVELAGVVGLVSRAGECEGWRRGDDVVAVTIWVSQRSSMVQVMVTVPPVQ